MLITHVLPDNPFNTIFGFRLCVKVGSKEFWEMSKDLDSDDDEDYQPRNRANGKTLLA